MNKHYELKQPAWCPNTTCNYICLSQDSLCFGLLPKQEDHAGINNTHRMCMRGASDDGEWIHSLKINKSDAWNMHRLLEFVFTFKPTSLINLTKEH